MTTIDEFKEMVDAHDLTYIYSDDRHSYRRGHDQKTAIMAAAQHLPREQVVKIWNAKVDATLGEGFRKGWYW